MALPLEGREDQHLADAWPLAVGVAVEQVDTGKPHNGVERGGTFSRVLVPGGPEHRTELNQVT